MLSKRQKHMLPKKTTFCFTSLAAALLLCGCGEKSSTPASGTSSSSSLADAPGNYLKAVVDDRQAAVKTIDVTSINKAIELFNVDQGRNPKDLQELAQKRFIPQVPVPPYGYKLAYDANAGSVAVVKQ
jgi:hypothetical protein